MMQKGIHLKDILTSSLVMGDVKVRGVDGLRQLADEHTAQMIKGKEKPAAFHIVHKVGDTTIDISLSNVLEMQAALQVIGYTKKGLLNRIKDWWWIK